MASGYQFLVRSIAIDERKIEETTESDEASLRAYSRLLWTLRAVRLDKNVPPRGDRRDHDVRRSWYRQESNNSPLPIADSGQTPHRGCCYLRPRLRVRETSLQQLARRHYFESVRPAVTLLVSFAGGHRSDG